MRHHCTDTVIIALAILLISSARFSQFSWQLESRMCTKQRKSCMACQPHRAQCLQPAFVTQSCPPRCLILSCFASKLCRFNNRRFCYHLTFKTSIENIVCLLYILLTYQIFKVAGRSWACTNCRTKWTGKLNDQHYNKKSLDRKCFIWKCWQRSQHHLVFVTTVGRKCGHTALSGWGHKSKLWGGAAIVPRREAVGPLLMCVWYSAYTNSQQEAIDVWDMLC